MSNYQTPDWAQATQPGQAPIINSIFDFSAEALGQLKVWLEQAGLNLPISNIVGFSQFTAQTATRVSTQETTTSSTYGDLATVGPQLTGIPAGKYLIFIGAGAAGNAGVSNANMSFQVNSTAASGSDACYTSSNSLTSISTVVSKTLTADSNTLTAKYASSDNVSTASFADRWMIALRYANS